MLPASTTAGNLVTERPQRTEQPPYWTQSEPAARWRDQHASPLRRFIGGSPVAVAIKLVVTSLIVGALLMWLRIRPADVFAELGVLFDQLWTLGFRSLQDVGTYLVAGAAIVLPVWLLLRVLSYRGR